MRGILRLGELCEDVLQNGRRLLQHVVVPVPLDSKSLSHQDGIPCRITRRLSVLTTIYFDDNALLETHKIENELLKRYMPPEFILREASITEQSPHRRFSVGRLTTHIPGEMADALGDRSMAWRLRREPLTRRRTSFGATLSHKGRGKVGVRFARNRHTRIGIST
jgi:hypothetical protein